MIPLLCFYSTFVCPTEIIAFSDRIAEFQAIETAVIGASTDSHFSHLAWINTPRKVSHTPRMGKKSICIQNFEYSNVFKKSFSWLGQKVNKRSMCIAMMPTTRALTCATSRQDLSTPFGILIKFEATEYSIRIQNFEAIKFDSNEILHTSHPYTL